MEPMILLAVLVLFILGIAVVAYKHSSTLQAVVASHGATLTSVVNAIAGMTPTAPAVATPVAAAQKVQLQPVAASPAVAAAPVVTLPAAVPVNPMPDTTAANAAFAARQTPQAAGFALVPYPGRPLQPADYQNLNATTVIADGNGFYLDNTGNVCHFESRPNGTTVKAMGYATVGPLA